MKDYVKPIVLANEELAEGVYAASGGVSDATCWTIDPYSVQDENGAGYHVFEVKIVHSDTVQHISTQSTSVITFNNVVTDAYSEGNCTASVTGERTVTVVRTLHANAYQSGDVATYKVWVKSSDLATTKALAVTGSSITDTGITENVQGLGGDGT